MRAEIIPDRVDGLYRWQMPDGRYIGDTDGNYLIIEGPRNSLKRMIELKKYVNEVLGIYVGQAVWTPAKPVTDSEHDDMMERMLDGKTPSFYEAAREQGDV